MGILDDIDEDKVANSIMEELGISERQDEPVRVAYKPKETPAQDTVQYIESDQEASSIDLELSEVERRLEKAYLYRKILSETLFESSGEIVQEVEEEFREFARNKLQTLMGISVEEPKPVEVKSPFTDDEIKVIKVLASKVLQNPKVIGAKKKEIDVSKTQDVVREPPKVTAQPKPPAAPQRPTLRKKKLPEEFTSATSTAKPAKVVPQLAAKQSPKPKTAQGGVPADQSVVEENGQHFKIMYVSMPNVDEFGIMDGMKIRGLQSGESCMLSNGIQVFKKGNTVTKVLRSYLPKNQNMPGRIPFPSEQQFAAMSEEMASAQVKRLPTIDRILGRK